MQLFCNISNTKSGWLKIKIYVDNFLNDKEKSDKVKHYKVVNDFYRKITDKNSSVELLRGFNIFACEIFPEEVELVMTYWGIPEGRNPDNQIATFRLLCQQLEEAGATITGFDTIEKLKAPSS